MKGLKIFSVVTSMVLALTIFTACSSFKGGYYEVGQYVYEDGSMRENYFILNVAPEHEYEVWMNVDHVEDDDANLMISFGYSSSGATLKKTTVALDKNILKDSDGWIRLYSGATSSYTYFDIGTKYAAHINEVIVWQGEDGVVLPATLIEAGYRMERGKTKNSHVLTEVDKEAIKNGPANVCDEQDLEFDRAAILDKYEKAVAANTTTSDSTSKS